MCHPSRFLPLNRETPEEVAQPKSKQIKIPVQEYDLHIYVFTNTILKISKTNLEIIDHGYSSGQKLPQLRQ